MIFITGLIRIIAIRIYIRIKLSHTGNNVSITALLTHPYTIQAQRHQFILAAASCIIGMASTAIDCKAISAFSISSFIVAQLVHIVAAVKTAAAKLAACITGPNAITISFISTETQLA